jgi:sec-independent protein translocase protein TatB
MFGFSGAELLVILGIALVVVGPERLPEIAKVIGKVYGEFQKAADELKREIQAAAAAAQKEKADSPPNRAEAEADNPVKDAGKAAPEEPQMNLLTDGSDKKED